MNKEEIAFNKGYRVTIDGECISPLGRILKLTYSKPYYRFCVKYDTKTMNIKVHRMQAYQKFGDKIYNENLVVRHVNGNYLDNSLDNIELGTDSENMMDVPEEIRIKKASNAAKIYSDELVTTIKRFKETHTYNETMQEYNISSKGTLYYIINKR